MQKLSVIIFSSDSPAKTMKLVNEIADVGDDIVIIYQGSRKYFDTLIEETRLNKKIHVEHTIALGYADPMRTYGLKRCRYDWVLYIDTDERISSELKNDLKKVINGSDCGAFAIKRYENAHIDGRRGDFFTWQIRLYRKDRIEYLGLLHEQPIVKGKLGKLDEKYCLLHSEELKTKGVKRRDLEYSKIKKYYDRLSYRMLRDRMRGYLDKLILPENKKIEETLVGKLVLGWMDFYQLVTLRKKDSEISTFDYFVFFSMIEGAYVLKRKDMNYLFNEAIPTVLKDTKSVSEFKSEGKSKMLFEISKEVNRMGITKYLRLDNDRVVERLYRKYKNGKQGIGLLLKLLEDRYTGNYP